MGRERERERGESLKRLIEKGRERERETGMMMVLKKVLLLVSVLTVLGKKF